MYVITDVSEKPLLPCTLVAIDSTETLVIAENTTWHHSPEDGNININIRPSTSLSYEFPYLQATPPCFNSPRSGSTFLF